jgi:hypothetical protein
MKIWLFKVLVMAAVVWNLGHQSGAQDAWKIPLEEKVALLEKAKKEGDEFVAQRFGLLTEIYGSEFFYNAKSRKFFEAVEKVLVQTPGFTDWAIHQLEVNEKVSDLGLAGCCWLLYKENEKLTLLDRDRIWNSLEAVRTHAKPLVRGQALQLTSLFRKDKDTYPIFFKAMDDDAPMEGRGYPIQYYAMGGVMESGKVTAEATQKLLRFIETDDVVGMLTAAGLPRYLEGHGKLRKQLLERYMNLMRENKGAVITMATHVRKLDPDPKETTQVLIGLYKKQKVEIRKLSLLVSISEVPGAAPFYERFYCEELVASTGNYQPGTLQSGLLTGLGKIDHLDPATIQVLRHLAASPGTNHAVEFRIRQLLQKQEMKP